MNTRIICPTCGEVDVDADTYQKDGTLISGPCPTCEERLYFDPPAVEQEIISNGRREFL